MTKNNYKVFEIKAADINLDRNKKVYTKEALYKMSTELIGKPFIDSNGEVIGKVYDAYISSGELIYKAEIMDEKLAEDIENGVTNRLSVGFKLDSSFIIED